MLPTRIKLFSFCISSFFGGIKISLEDHAVLEDAFALYTEPYRNILPSLHPFFLRLFGGCCVDIHWLWVITQLVQYNYFSPDFQVSVHICIWWVFILGGFPMSEAFCSFYVQRQDTKWWLYLPCKAPSFFIQLHTTTLNNVVLLFPLGKSVLPISKQELFDAHGLQWHWGCQSQLSKCKQE